MDYILAPIRDEDFDYFDGLPDLDGDDLDELGLDSPGHLPSPTSSLSAASAVDNTAAVDDTTAVDTGSDSGQDLPDEIEVDNDNDNDENSSDDGVSVDSLFSFLSRTPQNHPRSLSSELDLGSEARPALELFPSPLIHHQQNLLLSDEDDEEYMPPADNGLDDRDLDELSENEEGEGDEDNSGIAALGFPPSLGGRTAHYYFGRMSQHLDLALSARNMEPLQDNIWLAPRHAEADAAPRSRLGQLQHQLQQNQAQNPGPSRRRQAQGAGAQGPQTVIDLTEESSSPDEYSLLSRLSHNNRQQQPANRYASSLGLALPSSRPNRSGDSDSTSAHRGIRPRHSHSSSRQNIEPDDEDDDLFVPSVPRSQNARRGGFMSANSQRTPSLARSDSSILGSGVPRNGPRRAADRAPQARPNTIPSVIDLTTDLDDDASVPVPVPGRTRNTSVDGNGGSASNHVNGRQRARNGAPQPGGAVVIDLSHEEHDDDGLHAGDGAPDGGAGGARGGAWARVSNWGGRLTIGRLVMGGGNANQAGSNHSSQGPRQSPWLNRPVLGFHGNIQNPLGRGPLDLDYGANGYNDGDVLVGFDLGPRLGPWTNFGNVGRNKPAYKKPSAAGEGFTRDTNEARSKEEEVELVCAGCDEELKYDPDATNDDERPAKKRRKDNAEFHFWAVRECGHVFCKSCFENRKPLAKGAKKPAKGKGTPETRFRLDGRKLICAVEDCTSDTAAKGSWVGIFV